jgi:hypothetical protein
MKPSKPRNHLKRRPLESDKKSVHTLAQELGLSGKHVLAVCRSEGIQHVTLTRGFLSPSAQARLRERLNEDKSTSAGEPSAE